MARDLARAAGATGPPGPEPADMLRSLPAIRRDPLGYLEDCRDRWGDVVAFPAPRTPVWLVSDPAAARRVLQDNHPAYDKRTIQYDALATVTGQGLLTSDPPLWRRQRRLLQPAFHRDALGGAARAAVTAADRVDAEWAATAADVVVDVDASMLRATLDVVAGAVLGADLDHGTDEVTSSVLGALETVVRRARSPLRPPPAVPTPGNLRLRRHLRTLDAAVARVVAQHRRVPAGEGRAADLVDLLLAAVDDPEQEVDDRLLRDEVATMVVAGHETVASALTWTWHLLAGAPQAQERLHAELDDVLGGRPPSHDDVPRLAWTRAVVDEALRLYPPAWVVTRRAVAPDELLGHALPAGALVIVSPWVVQRHPAVWREGHRFLPERFLPGGEEVPRGAYLPFGAGPRLCIGRDFALVESVLLLAALAQRWRVRPGPGGPPRVESLVTLRPAHGLPLALERRAPVTAGR